LTGREGRIFVLGRVAGLQDGFGSLRGYIATGGYGGRVFDRTTSDGTGRFVLEFERESVAGLDFIDIYVTSASGARAGASRLRVTDLDSPPVVILRAIRNPAMPLAAAARTGPIRRFAVNGETTLLVDSSCSEVVLDWEVGEGSAPRDLQVVLSVDRRMIDPDLPLQGSVSLRDRSSAEYALAVGDPTHAGAILDRRTVKVKRFPTLSLCFEDAPGWHQSLQMGVAISCPAPEGGLPVTLVSSDKGKVGEGHFVIQKGQVWGVASLECGTRTGGVEVTGMAPGYLRDSVRLVVPTR
jgi:hypothetical protein